MPIEGSAIQTIIEFPLLKVGQSAKYERVKQILKHPDFPKIQGKKVVVQYFQPNRDAFIRQATEGVLFTAVGTCKLVGMVGVKAIHVQDRIPHHAPLTHIKFLGIVKEVQQ